MHYKGVGADGHRWTMVGIIKPIDKDSFTWQKTEQISGGKPTPNSPEIKLIRKGTTPSNSKNNEKPSG